MNGQERVCLSPRKGVGLEPEDWPALLPFILAAYSLGVNTALRSPRFSRCSRRARRCSTRVVAQAAVRGGCRGARRAG